MAMKSLSMLCAMFWMAAFASGANAHAAGELVAEPSSTVITEEDNLSVEFKTSVDGVNADIGDVRYDAPDFEEVNSYARSQEVESRFINGQITVRRSVGVVVVLHPKKAGNLAIRNIQVTAGGQILRAADLTIDVKPAGTRLSGRGSGLGYPSQGQLPSGGVRSPHDKGGSIFIRTEPERLKAYKGEQIILTYALYTRVNVLNIQVERYPNVTGFLKEDVDIPLLRGQLDYSPSVVNGREYRRAVLAQYAIYPLKDGLLPIDTFTGRFAFQAGGRYSPDDDDPFQMFNQFFRAMQTTTESRTSDRVNIEVLPLPAAGQPANFSGLVGDFDVTAVVDKYSVKAGEPINVKVKVEGKGHAGSLEKLNIAWPADFELYEDKSNTNFVKTGHTERLFEYMLIPKTKGKFEIPAIELTMFNPDLKSYQVRKTQPMAIEVLEGAGGTNYIPKPKTADSSSSGVVAPKEDIRYWMDAPLNSENAYRLRAVARGFAMGSMALVVLSLWALSGNALQSRRQEQARAVQAIRSKAKALLGSSAAPVEILGEVESLLGQALENRYGIFIGSLTRPEIRVVLLEKGGEALAKRVESLLELCENQRYAPGGGDRSAAERAAAELYGLMDQVYSA